MRNQRIITIQYIKNFLKEIDSKAELLSDEYIDNSKPLKFKCCCGTEFNRCFSNIQQRKSCQCISCGHKKGWREKRREKEYKKDIIDSFANCGYKVINYQDIKLNNSKYLVEDKLGYRGHLKKRDAELGKHFSTFSIRFNEDNLLYNLQNFCNINKFTTKVICYWKDKRYVRLYCECECGEKYITNVCDFTTQNRVYCKKCTKSQSRYERAVEKELIGLNIFFEKQKTFQDCKNNITNYSLRFDFYLPNYNICIEVDGEQHFYPVNFSGLKDENAENNYLQTSHSDKIKDNYCLLNNIKLIRISYIDIKNKSYVDVINSIVTK